MNPGRFTVLRLERRSHHCRGPSLKPVLLLLTALLAGCGTTAATLGYSPTEASRVQATPLVSAITVTDARDEKDPTYIGAIRGGFGNPLKTLVSARPVKDEVAAAFEAALRARNLYGLSGPAVLAVTLTQLSANQFARREGHTKFSLVLSDRATGRTLFQDTEDVLKVGGSLITFDAGVFASVEDLRTITALSLSQAIDQALDKPGFAAAR